MRYLDIEKPRIPIQAWANDPYYKAIATVYNPSTSYSAGDTVIAPNGSLVKALDSTTGDYDSTKWEETNIVENLSADSGISEVTISTAGDVTQALDANKIYHFTGALTSLTITLAAASGLPQYHFDFISGATPVTLTLPSSVVMPDSFSVEANNRYEIDILNNYGVAQSWGTT